MSRNKQRVNYKEPNDITIRRPKLPKVKVIANVPNHEKYTIYHEFKRHGLILAFSDDIEMNSISETEWYPLSITSVVTVDGEPAIKCKIETKTEIGDSTILENEWIPEMYLGALAAINPNKLNDKKWKGIYYDRKLPDTYSPKYSVGDKVYLTVIVHCNHIRKCGCIPSKQVVAGTIKAVDAHKLALQLTPQFLFEAEQPELTSIANGWVFTCQLSHDLVKWRHITISEIIIYEIRHYISIGYGKFTSSPLIIGNIPDDIKVNNAYFGLYECYIAQQAQYQMALKSKSLIIFLAQNIINNLIKSTYSSIGRSSILSYSIKRKMSTRNLFLYGVPVEPMVIEIGMNGILDNLNVSKRINLEKILFTMSIPNLEAMGISKVLNVLSNKTEIHLNNGITFEWGRKQQYMFISKFSIIKKNEKMLKYERNLLNN